LQAALPGAQQESDEDGEGEDAVASEIFRVDAMLGDEGGIMERLREIGEDCGMDTAKSVSFSFLTYQWIMEKHYTIFLNLTALHYNPHFQRQHSRGPNVDVVVLPAVTNGA
jgi:hypothetical protein